MLQAFANLAANRLQSRRAPYQFASIFSNLLDRRRDSIFFFRRWQTTYTAFQRTIRRHYHAGCKWVADFDLAAFYDTISHDLLIKTIYPRSKGDDLDWFKGCLQMWSSERLSSCHGHGIPQGPLASDFLAECFLLPVDEAMSGRGYFRYVDDVRLMGKTENEVRSGILELELRCRERGLIPQTGKFAIKRARSVDEATAMLPSIAEPQHEAGAPRLSTEEARELMSSSIHSRPYRVKDKTRLRYVLYRAQPDSHLLKLVLLLLPRHPEHADAFFAYISGFGYRTSIGRLCLALVRDSSYAYIRGQAWHVLARYCLIHGKLKPSTIVSLTDHAVTLARQKSGADLMEKWGALSFLCSCEAISGNHYTRWLNYQPPLLQSLLAPALPAAAFDTDGAAKSFLSRSSIEPGLSVCSRMNELGIGPAKLGLSETQLPTQVQNTLRDLGLIASPKTKVDPIAEILKRKYAIAPRLSWHTFLSSEYLHTMGLLKQAEAAFNSNMSFWMANQNSFNHAVFLALQRHLQENGLPGVCKTVDRNNQLIEFGVMLDKSQPFAKAYPRIADCFREMNTRRNQLPPMHPYDKKTGVQTRYLRVQERNKFVGRLKTAYQELVNLVP